MKACLYLQRRFAYIGHELAKTLKADFGVSEFCGYVEQRSSLKFLQEQKDINYSTLLLDEDIVGAYANEPLNLAYLAELEKKYGKPSLWPYLAEDRVIRYSLLVRAYPSDSSRYSHEEMLRMLQTTARAIEDMLEKEKPDFIFMSVISGLGSYLLYTIAKAKGIKTYSLFNPRIEERYAITDNPFSDPTLRDSIMKMGEHRPEDKVFISRAEEFIAEFRKKPTYYLEKSKAAAHYQKKNNRASYFSFLALANLNRTVSWFFKSFYDFYNSPAKNDYSTINPWYETWDKAKRKARILRGYNDLFDQIKPDEDYAFFPLQSEPEGLPMLLAPNYATDQIWVVKQVARSLPVHFKLYVKEHPVMIGKRPRSYYEALKKIPNVRLLNPGLSALALIDKAKLIFTISSTTGMEAVLLGKPIITLSDVFYAVIPGVGRCRSVEELPELVKEKLTNFKSNETDIVNTVAFFLKESVPVDLTQLWDVEGGSTIQNQRQTLYPLAELLMKKVSKLL